MIQRNSIIALVVDDSAVLRQRVIEMMSGISGLDVAEAQNPAEALTALQALKPDLVILDIQLPGGSGIEVLRLIKQDYPNTRVVMFTNHPEKQYRDRCLELRADYFLSKSTDVKLLIEIGQQLAARGPEEG